MDQFTKELQFDPSNLEDLKFVLNVVTRISDRSMDMELMYLDIAERYSTLTRYDIRVEESEISIALGLSERWRKLWVDSKTKDLRLVDVKDEFREVTKEQAVSFIGESVKVKKEFPERGPGSSNITLAEGNILLDEYTKKIHQMNSQKKELIVAENMFNLDVTSYPALSEIEHEMEKLTAIYGIYREFKDFEEGQSSTLWGDLNIDTLQVGVADLEKKCKVRGRELNA